MPTVAEIIDQMKAKFNPDAAAGLDVVFQFDIEDGETYNLTVKDGTCEIANGAHDAPSVTLIMSSDTLAGIMSGETDGMQAFMGGKLRAEGNIMLATKLADLFPVN
ncbi:SCP2 sterol-binding domain-containing protein [Aestuariirhabdus litorea]|uniref:SCP-2 family sterol carrier protein n=1 Tax=Aestuariirhabdus litorea TaxID=2528527 RepID=A0A3P3VR05_9GAMM|nr:SCP2 sterol-binding domain-containing protein [Aestuariirhabdus litorea]RRJ84884.1 SCP-2 family sterol carrier protein [Aestuariirhabdus litorea]RWW98110.1 SCP2 sterol-binding domain-containing protein [Endozoicomonadaceae bacterium GTF-13]